MSEHANPTPEIEEQLFDEIDRESGFAHGTKLSPMQRAGEFVRPQEDRADAIHRMDATAREVMAAIASQKDVVARLNLSGIAAAAYDAAEALEAERERRLRLPEVKS